MRWRDERERQTRTNDDGGFDPGGSAPGTRRTSHSGGAGGRWQGCAGASAPCGARGVAAGAGSCRSGGPAGGAGGKPGAGVGPDPVRPDAGVALHVLSRRRLSDGRRPSGGSPHRTDGSAVRRCPPVELRDLRRPGPPTRVQPQRLRRDPPWPVRVGRQAAGGQLRRRGTRSRFRRDPARGHQPRGGGVVPGSHARLGWDAEAGRLVRTVGRRRARGRVEPPAQVGRAQEIPQECRQGARQGQHQGLRQAGRGGRTDARS